MFSFTLTRNNKKILENSVLLWQRGGRFTWQQVWGELNSTFRLKQTKSLLTGPSLDCTTFTNHRRDCVIFFPSDYENLEYCLHYNIHFVAWPTFANIKHTYLICNVALLIVRPHVRPLCKATKTSGIWGNNVTQ